MNDVFLDTVGLLALWDSSDQWHEPAAAAFSEISEANSDLLTTTFVLLECANAAARRSYRAAVDRLRTVLKHADRLIVPSDEIWNRLGSPTVAVKQTTRVSSITFRFL